MRKKSHISTKSEIKSIIVSLLACFCVLAFEIVTILPFRYMTAISSNYGALYYASLFAGKKWSLETNLPYFQLIPTVFYGLLMKLIDGNPERLWKCILIISAIVRSIPAFISTRVVTKYYKINYIVGFIIGIFSSLAITNRVTIIDNNVFVMLFMWILFVLLIQVEKKKKYALNWVPYIATLIATVLIGIDIQLIGLFLVVCIYFSVILMKRNRLQGSTFILYSACMLILIWWIQKLFVNALFSDIINPYKVEGTFYYMFKVVSLSFTRLFSFSGIKMLLIGIFSRYWTLVVFSFGLLFIPLSRFVFLMKDKTTNSTGGLVVTIFTISLLAEIVFESYCDLEKMCIMDYRHLFDYSSFFVVDSLFSFAPILMVVGVVFVAQLIVTEKNIDVIFLTLFGISSFVLSLFMYFSLATTRNFKNIGFFIHNPSFLIRISNSFEITDYGHFILGCSFVVLLFYIGFISKSDIKSKVIIITIPFALMYTINGLYTDYTFIKETNIYSYLDLLQDFNSSHNGAIEKSEVLYCDNSSEIGKLAQFIFSDTTIKNEYPSENDEEFILITTSSIEEHLYDPVVNGCYYSELDDKNYLYIKGEEYLALVNSSELDLEYINNEYFEDLYRLYVCVLDRYPSFGELSYWSGNITSGTMTYHDVVECFFLSQEFQGREYKSKQLYDIMTRFFFDEDFEDDSLFVLSNNEKQEWIDMIEGEISFSELIDNFIESDYCVIEV